jgi:hypothetical protein
MRQVEGRSLGLEVFCEVDFVLGKAERQNVPYIEANICDFRYFPLNVFEFVIDMSERKVARPREGIGLCDEERVKGQESKVKGEF